MPTLWVSTPFARDKCDEEVTDTIDSISYWWHNANGESDSSVPLAIGADSGASKYKLDRLRDSLFFGGASYAFADISFSRHDILFVVAHGSSDQWDGRRTRVKANVYAHKSLKGLGYELSADDLCTALESVRGASLLSKIFFSICYSALPNHCARVWKQTHMGMEVYGVVGAAGTAMSIVASTDYSGKTGFYGNFCTLKSVNPDFVRMLY